MSSEVGLAALLIDSDEDPWLYAEVVLSYPVPGAEDYLP